MASDKNNNTLHAGQRVTIPGELTLAADQPGGNTLRIHVTGGGTFDVPAQFVEAWSANAENAGNAGATNRPTGAMAAGKT